MDKHSFWKWWSRRENTGDSGCLHLFFITFLLATGAVGCQFLTKESSPHPWQWKFRVLTTGPPRNSHVFHNIKHQENREELRYRQNVETRQRKRSYLSFLRLEGKEERWWEVLRAESGVVSWSAFQLETQRGATAPEKGSLQGQCWWTMMAHQGVNKVPEPEGPSPTTCVN